MATRIGMGIGIPFRRDYGGGGAPSPTPERRQVDIFGVGLVEAEGHSLDRGQVDIFGVGLVDASGHVIERGQVDIFGVGIVDAAGRILEHRSADILGVGLVYASAHVEERRSADILGVGRMEAAGQVVVWTPAARNPSVWYEGLPYAYKDTAGVTPVTTINDMIALWKNRGSISADGSQAGVINRPTAAAVAPTLRPNFDGNDWLDIASSAITSSSASTMWLRFRNAASVVGNTAIGCPAAVFIGPGGLFDLIFAPLYTGGYPSGIYFLLGGVTSQSGVYVPFVADTAWHTLLISRTPGGTPNASNPTEYKVWIDGVPQTPQVAPTLSAGGTSSLGKQTSIGNYYYGDMPSVGRCLGALTNAEAAQFTAYLSTMS